MDIYSNVDTQVPKDARSSDESSVNDLANDLTKSLNIQGEPKLVSDSIKPFDVSGFKEEDQHMCEEPHQSQMTIVTSEKFLSKSSTFPCSSKIAISDGEIKEKEAANGVVLEPKGHAKSVTPPGPCQRSISLPAPSNLKSAMKGSREKNGIQPNNLTVTWAPEVYDPTPTAVSHVVTTNKNQTRSKKKNGGKNKQKGGGNGSGAAAGKTSRGARGKEKKKQARKYSGTTSNGCLKSLDEDDRVVDNDPNGQRTDLGDFNIGSPDPHCGSSFLKKSVTKMHFSLTEAT